MLRFATIILSCLSSFGAIYYVSPISGNDSNTGTSKSSPWKHGGKFDPLSTGVAASTSLSGGGSILFEDGTTNRISLTLTESGASTNSMIIFGAWTNGTALKPIIEGAERIVTPWTNATSMGQVRGNTNYAHIWMATLPTNFRPLTSLIVNGEYGLLSQDGNATNNWRFDDFQRWQSITNASVTSMTNATFFTQSSNIFTDSYVGVWIQGNELDFRLITGFDSIGHSITYNPLSHDPYLPPNPDYFSIINNPYWLDQNNEYASSTTDGKLYLYSSTFDPNTEIIEYGVRTNGFLIASQNYIKIQDLAINNFFGGLGDAGYTGCGISAGSSIGIIVTNCSFKGNRSIENSGVVSLTSSCNNFIIASLNITNSMRSRATILAGNNGVAMNCNLGGFGRTGLYLQGGSNFYATNITVSDVWGVHGNAVSTYGPGCWNVRMDAVQIHRAQSAFTAEAMTNYTLINPIVDGENIASGRSDFWSTMGGAIGIFNGVFQRPTNTESTVWQIEAALNPDARLNGGVKMWNCVIAGGGITDGDGLGSTNRQHNIYTSLADYQSSAHGWHLLNGETYNTNIAAIFNDPTHGDFTAKVGGPLIDTGFDASSIGFTTDILGVTRPQGSAWDIGTYEYITSAPPVTPIAPVILQGRFLLQGKIIILP